VANDDFIDYSFVEFMFFFMIGNNVPVVVITNHSQYMTMLFVPVYDRCYLNCHCFIKSNIQFYKTMTFARLYMYIYTYSNIKKNIYIYIYKSCTTHVDGK